ncbi:hypothetical protein DCAR_0101035 [Daucus carota subsp. sativus]|uniref:Retrotransposon gag domain-containing protein n=1 Tax=Daucus carota subsp. sativus TaxID=79200 RepID=A0AAF0W3Y2_DAUCS|nr:hypothetical protein DCAR_0101035 [Daucus carota subsp. sativus]
MSQCYILAAMSGVLQHQHQAMELFGDQNRAAMQVAMKALMNTQMVEGTPIDIILLSLTKSFEQFRLNDNMNKRQYSLAELLTELQAAEGLFHQSVQVNVAEKGTQDPVEAQSWLKEMEKAFRLVVVTDEKKVEYASYFLKGETNYWWESVRALEEGEVIAWDRFKKIFLDKYFPRYVQTQMELKFFELKQEG